MEPLNISSLGFGAKAGICWGFFWRGLVMALGSMIAGGVLGALLGFLFASAGLPKASGAKLATWTGFGLGMATGAVILYWYIRWLLSARLGKYRLLLVSTTSSGGV